ncbi:hypothetical protein KM043_016615 [Ampulex compressa]|nr:hypothetical protein KM043_016615 [Ampulex compressa]
MMTGQSKSPTQRVLDGGTQCGTSTTASSMDLSHRVWMRRSCAPHKRRLTLLLGSTIGVRSAAVNVACPNPRCFTIKPRWLKLTLSLLSWRLVERAFLGKIFLAVFGEHCHRNTARLLESGSSIEVRDLKQKGRDPQQLMPRGIMVRKRFYGGKVYALHTNTLSPRERAAAFMSYAGNSAPQSSRQGILTVGGILTLFRINTSSQNLVQSAFNQFGWGLPNQNHTATN